MQPRWPLTEERIKRCGTHTRRGILLSQEKGTSVKYMCTMEYYSTMKRNKSHVYTMEYYSAMKRNKYLLHVHAMEDYSAMKRNKCEVHIQNGILLSHEKEQM